MKLTINQIFENAMKAHREGNIQDAERFYNTVLQHQPFHPDANHNLGLLLVSVGRHDIALNLFKAALEINPKMEQFWVSYIETLIKHQQFENAKQVLEQAKKQDFVKDRLKILEVKLSRKTEIESVDNFSPPQKQLKSLLDNYNNGRLDDAEKIALAITKEFPKNKLGWKILGATLGLKGEIFKAFSINQATVDLFPNDAEAYNNLGITLKKLARLEESEVNLRKAIKLKPDMAEAYSNLSVTLKELGRFEEAEISLKKAIKLKPDMPETYTNLGVILNKLDRFEEAEISLKRAIKLKPDMPETYSSLGVSLMQIGRFEEAEISLKKAIELKPEWAKAKSSLLFLNSGFNYEAKLYLKEAQDYGRIITKSVVSQFTNWLCDKEPKKLRIGLVSGDFRNHPVGFFLEGLIKQLNKKKLELFAYSNMLSEDDLTFRIKPYFKKWRKISGINDEASASLIHNDGIHILIDLSGHTSKHRLPVFSWKPAAIQISWLGYFASTGLAEIDYILGDRFVTPTEEACNFTEEIWQLPDGYLCFTAPETQQDVESLPALTNGAITFGCFNKIARMNDNVVSVWSRILTSIPDSKLYLKDKSFKESKSRNDVYKRFEIFGINKERLILEKGSPRNEYLASYNRVDIALSPFPYGGVTTSLEGLWMGVPVIIKRGNYFLSHMGESIAHNAGLSDWIALDEDDYVLKAIKLSSNFNRLANLRSKLRGQVLSSPLFDSKRFANHFEKALWSMWNIKNK